MSTPIPTQHHRIVIETRDAAPDSGSPSATGSMKQGDKGSIDERRLSMAAMDLVSELKGEGVLTQDSRRLSHYITVEHHHHHYHAPPGDGVLDDSTSAFSLGCPPPPVARCYSNHRHSSASDYYLPSHRASTSSVLRNSDCYPSTPTSGHRLSLQPETLFEEDIHEKTNRQERPVHCERGRPVKQKTPSHMYHHCQRCHHPNIPNDGADGSPHDKMDTPWNGYYEKIRKTLSSLFQKYWFLLGLGLVIGLAWAFPQVGKTNGTIQAQYTIKWCAVIIIFLLSGLGIDVRVMPKVIMQWRLHLVVQGINFLVLPFIMYGVVLFFITVGAQLDSVVYKGWIIAMSTSTTVSSNVVMTRNAKGSDSSGTQMMMDLEGGYKQIVNIRL